MGKIQKYRIFNGQEFVAASSKPLAKAEAKREITYWKRDIHIKRTKFPVKGRLVKVKGGFVPYINNTVHNMNEWERRKRRRTSGVSGATDYILGA